MRPTFLLWTLALLLVAGAAAQPGPAPGYDDPLLYAQDHYADEAGQATADPAGYAQDHASAEAAGDEAAHAAYVACWTADFHADQNPDVCDEFYTAPDSVQALQPPADEEPLPEEETTEAAVEAVDEFATEVTDAVDDIIADPTSAPGVLASLGEAAVAFATTVVGLVLLLVGGIAQGAVATVQGVLDGLGALGGLGVSAASGTGDALGSLSSLVGSALGAVVGTVWSGLGGLGDLSIQTAGSGLDGLTSGATAFGAGVAWAWDAGLAAAGAVASGIGSAVSAVGHGISDAAGAVKDAVADAVDGIKDALSSLFEGGASSSEDGLGHAVDDLTGDDGLVDGLLDLLP